MILINFKLFCSIWKTHIEYNRNQITNEDLDIILHKAYVGYKNWCKELYELSVEDWICEFYQDLEIDSHNMCLKSKLKGLKDLAYKSKLK